MSRNLPRRHHGCRWRSDAVSPGVTPLSRSDDGEHALAEPSFDRSVDSSKHAAPVTAGAWKGGDRPDPVECAVIFQRYVSRTHREGCVRRARPVIIRPVLRRPSRIQAASRSQFVATSCSQTCRLLYRADNPRRSGGRVRHRNRAAHPCRYDWKIATRSKPVSFPSIHSGSHWAASPATETATFCVSA
jgi:hypothetical protein